jgi:hypothetical protein
VDELLDRLLTSIDPREQIPLHRRLLQEAMGDVAIMPLYWEVAPVLVARGITGVTYSGTSNLMQWDRD